MSLRNIHTRNKVFQWTYIKSKVLIFTPESIKVVVPDSEISGMSGWELERAKWKHVFRITPKMVKKYIEEHLA
jgi:hypothetical protein